MKSLQTLALAALACAAPFAPDAAAQTRYATLYTYTNSFPVGLTLGKDVLYGALASGCGVIFELEPPNSADGPWTEATLYSFRSEADACDPYFGPILGTSGVLHGLTNGGGTYGFGALYELQPPASPGDPWTESVPFSFGAPGSGISEPVSRLVPGPNGFFYVLASGGVFGGGALVQLRPPASPGGFWSSSVLYSFPTGAPPVGLMMGAHGALYGTTLYNNYGPGLVFQLTPPTAPGEVWTETVIYSPTSGSTPNSLTAGPGGILYGTAYGTGEFPGRAEVFQLTPPESSGGSWTYALLRRLGVDPLESPLLLQGGKLYTTNNANHGGALLELDPPSAPGSAWTVKVLHEFPDNGQVPGGALVMDKRGTIYGATTVTYMQPNSGSVYRYATR